VCVPVLLTGHCRPFSEVQGVLLHNSLPPRVFWCLPFTPCVSKWLWRQGLSDHGGFADRMGLRCVAFCRGLLPCRTFPVSGLLDYGRRIEILVRPPGAPGGLSFHPSLCLLFLSFDILSPALESYLVEAFRKRSSVRVFRSRRVSSFLTIAVSRRPPPPFPRYGDHNMPLQQSTRRASVEPSFQ